MKYSLKELELRKPNYFLNVDTSSLGSAVGDIIKKSEDVLKKKIRMHCWYLVILIHAFQPIWQRE